MRFKNEVMYYLKFNDLYAHMVNDTFVRIDKSPLITHTNVEDAEDEARKVAKFLDHEIEVCKVEVIGRFEP